MRVVAHRQAEHRCHLDGRGQRSLYTVPIGVGAVQLKAEGGPEQRRTDGRTALHLGVTPVFPGHGETPGHARRKHVPQLTLAVIGIAQDTPGDGAGDAGNAAALHRSTHLLITLTGFQIHGQVAQRVTAPQHAGLVAKGKALSGAGGKNSVKHPAAPPFPAHTVLRASGPPPSAPCCICTGSLRYWAAGCAGAAELSSRSPTGCWKPR